MYFRSFDVGRELTRGMRNGEYNAKRAQRAANTSISSRKHKHQKIQGDVQEKVIALLGKRFSPQQIATTLFKEDGVKISRVAVYGFIKREDRAGNLVQFLRRGGGRGRRRRGTNRLKIPNRTDISERTGFDNTRSRYGDWECDGTSAGRRGYSSSVLIYVLSSVGCSKNPLFHRWKVMKVKDEDRWKVSRNMWFTDGNGCKHKNARGVFWGKGGEEISTGMLFSREVQHKVGIATER